MRLFFKRTTIGLTICLGIITVLWAGYVLPSVVKEIVQPTSSFAGPINQFLARICAGVLAIAASLETTLLLILLSRRWMRRSAGITVMLIYGAIALLSLLLCILLSQHRVPLLFPNS